MMKNILLWALIILVGSMPILTIFLLFIYPQMADQIPLPWLKNILDAIRDWLVVS